MSSRTPRAAPVAAHRTLAAVASPARQELVAALGLGPATVRELGARLGRSRQALHYHIAVLVRAGLARAQGWRGAGREREQVYALVSDRIAVAARAGSPRELTAAGRAVAAMLRLTGREMTEAMGAPGVRRAGAGREMLALRAKARLTPTELRRLNALLDQIQSLLQGAGSRTPHHRLYALTIVLTPSRESAAKARPMQRGS